MQLMPRLVLRVVLSTVLLLLVTSMNSATILASVSPTPYVNREHGFHIYPPSGWEVDESSVAKIPGAVVIFWGDYESQTGGTVNIMISSKSVASTTSLEQYVSDEKGGLASIGYRILSESRREINGLPCIELVATGVGTTSLGSFTLKQKQVIFLQNGKVYWLSFMASTKYYEMYLTAFEESLQTFGLGLPEKGE
jgi:hypothetical protein